MCLYAKVKVAPPYRSNSRTHVEGYALRPNPAGARVRGHDPCSPPGEGLPVDLSGRFIYYVGPVDPVREEGVGPAGPTTATRMDKFTRTMLEKSVYTFSVVRLHRDSG